MLFVGFTVKDALTVKPRSSAGRLFVGRLSSSGRSRSMRAAAPPRIAAVSVWLGNGFERSDAFEGYI
jgi:hypothetical protein